MKIALCQMENKGTVRENMEQSIQAIKEAALQKADLILIPTVNTKAEPSEMFEWELVHANGDTIVKADDKAQILYADIDMKEAAQIRSSRPYINLRRKEFYL